MRLITTRDEFPDLLTELELTGMGVEVGVQEGLFSEHLLARWPGILFSVDPWRHYAEYPDLANVSQDEQDTLYRVTVRRLFQASKIGRCHVWRMTGREACTILPQRSLDFVYLDARHDRASVMQDLIDWTPLVKPGGLISGHDYLDGDVTFDRVENAEGHVLERFAPTFTQFGVKSAVDEWARLMGWTVHVSTDDAFPTWYCEVP